MTTSSANASSSSTKSTTATSSPRNTSRAASSTSACSTTIAFRPSPSANSSSARCRQTNTYRAGWDEEYRRRWRLQNQFAEGLDPALAADIVERCKRIYHLLTIDGSARVDLRVTAQGEMYFIEAKPNPMLAGDEDIAQSALKAGLSDPQLIDRILRLGLKGVRA